MERDMFVLRYVCQHRLLECNRSCAVYQLLWRPLSPTFQKTNGCSRDANFNPHENGFLTFIRRTIYSSFNPARVLCRRCCILWWLAETHRRSAKGLARFHPLGDFQTPSVYLFPMSFSLFDRQRCFSRLIWAFWPSLILWKKLSSTTMPWLVVLSPHCAAPFPLWSVFCTYEWVLKYYGAIAVMVSAKQFPFHRNIVKFLQHMRPTA